MISPRPRRNIVIGSTNYSSEMYSYIYMNVRDPLKMRMYITSRKQTVLESIEAHIFFVIFEGPLKSILFKNILENSSYTKNLHGLPKFVSKQMGSQIKSMLPWPGEICL